MKCACCTLLFAVLFTGASAFADYRDAIGHTALAAELGGSLPTGAGIAVTQVEAPESTVGNYEPDPNHAEFQGKTFTLKAGDPDGFSFHATTVGRFIYGSATSQSPGITNVTNYNANGWLSDSFLSPGVTSSRNLEPLVETSDVQNHSWIGSIGASDVDRLRRLDFTVNRDDFVVVVGLNNGSGNAIPTLMANAYNILSVGRSDGEHSTGQTTVDGSGRIKPEIVAPESVTSWTTGIVSSAAALLIKTARSGGLTEGDRSQVVKALLMAGATKDEFATWTRTANRPLDLHFGAGELNIQNSHRILVGGRQQANASAIRASTGWDFGSTVSNGSRLYFFDIGAGQKARTFSAILTWHRVVQDTINGPSWGNPSSSLADLTLRLYQASGFTLGAQIDASTSSLNNVEHVFQRDLPVGRYALEVTGDAGSISYGLAWESQIIALPVVSVAATDNSASEFGVDNATFEIERALTEELNQALTVHFTIGGSATNGLDYGMLANSVTIPAGSLNTAISVNPLTDILAEGPETVILTIVADPSYVVGASSQATVTIKDRPVDQWRFEKFTAVELADPSISGDLADPEGDGIVNLAEYGLRLEPKIAELTGLPVVTMEGGLLQMKYTRVKSAVDISYLPEVTENLDTYESDPDVLETIDVADHGETEEITVRAAAPVEPRQFLRLKITPL